MFSNDLEFDFKLEALPKQKRTKYSKKKKKEKNTVQRG